MTPDELFLSTVEDIEGRLARLRAVEVAGRVDRYELTMVASLLRKLLIDGGSLVSLVNQTRRLRLRFSVSGWPFVSGTSLGGQVSLRRRGASLGKIATITTDQLTPELLGMLAVRRITLHQLLAEPVVTWNEVPITAKGLITYLANLGGGVHVGGQATGPVEEAIDKFGRDLFIDGYPLAEAGIWDVAEVAISGLQPLGAVIAGDAAFGTGLLTRQKTR
jgi:hypothetical protein